MIQTKTAIGISLFIFIFMLAPASKANEAAGMNEQFNKEYLPLIEDLDNAGAAVKKSVREKLLNDIAKRPGLFQQLLSFLVEHPGKELTATLTKAPEEKLPEVIDFYKKLPPEKRALVIYILNHFENSPREAAKFLIDETGSTDALSRHLICLQLAQNKSLEFSDFREMLFSQDKTIQSAGFSLVQYSRTLPVEAFSVLYELASSPDLEVAGYGEKALLHCSKKHLEISVPFFMEKLKTGDQLNQGRAISHLLKTSYSGFDFHRALVEIAETDKSFFGVLASAALEQMNLPLLPGKDEFKFTFEKTGSEVEAVRESSLKRYCRGIGNHHPDFYPLLLKYSQNHPGSRAISVCLFNTHQIPPEYSRPLLEHVVNNMKFYFEERYVYQKVNKNITLLLSRHLETSKPIVQKALYHENPDSRLGALYLYFQWQIADFKLAPALIEPLDAAILHENKKIAGYGAWLRMQLHKQYPLNEKVKRKIIEWYRQKDPGLEADAFNWLAGLGYFSQKELPDFVDVCRQGWSRTNDEARYALTKISQDAAPFVLSRLTGTFDDVCLASILKNARGALPGLFDFIQTTAHSHEYYIFLLNSTRLGESDVPFLLKYVQDARLGRYAVYALHLLEHKLKKSLVSKETWLSLHKENDITIKSFASLRLALDFKIMTPDYHAALLYLAALPSRSRLQYKLNRSYFSLLDDPELNEKFFELLSHKNERVRYHAAEKLYYNLGYLRVEPGWVFARPLRLKITPGKIRALESLLDDLLLGARGYAAALLYRLKKFHLSWSDEKYIPWLKYTMLLPLEGMYTQAEITAAYYLHPEMQSSLLTGCLQSPDHSNLLNCFTYAALFRNGARPEIETLMQRANAKGAFVSEAAIRMTGVIGAESELDLTKFFGSLLASSDLTKQRASLYGLLALGPKAHPLWPRLKKLKEEISQKLKETKNKAQIKTLKMVEKQVFQLFLLFPYDQETTTQALLYYRDQKGAGHLLNHPYLLQKFQLTLERYPDAL